ncbi:MULTISPECIES: hypothetical protein [unclassified Mesorhizobium]|uniref:hypothetical protein n=1 Tax=unclassified Mesorhizobium TaxID=325217 RepID=UPI00167AB8CA|nr:MULTISPECIES: hypothetical protein [unclassified Mesorhizobium]
MNGHVLNMIFTDLPMEKSHIIPPYGKETKLQDCQRFAVPGRCTDLGGDRFRGGGNERNTKQEQQSEPDNFWTLSVQKFSQAAKRSLRRLDFGTRGSGRRSPTTPSRQSLPGSAHVGAISPQQSSVQESANALPVREWNLGRQALLSIDSAGVSAGHQTRFRARGSLALHCAGQLLRARCRRRMRQ